MSSKQQQSLAVAKSNLLYFRGRGPTKIMLSKTTASQKKSCVTGLIVLKLLKKSPYSTLRAKRILEIFQR